MTAAGSRGRASGSARCSTRLRWCRCCPNWDEWAQQVSDSRMYGGVHYRFSNEAGEEIGRKAARMVIERALRPLPKGEEALGGDVRRTGAGRGGRRGRLARSALAWVPSSTMRPWSMTTMRSAARTVARRWAMTIVVRSAISRSSASWTSRSLSASSARGRFVEQQQRRVAAEQGAGDGDALALAARQARAAFAHEGVEALGKRAEEGLRHWRRAPPAQISSSLASQLP